MENINTSPIEKNFCAACSIETLSNDTFCKNCGYPLKGTEQEQGNFIAQMTVNEIDMSEYRQKIKKAGNSLYYVAASLALGMLLAANKMEDHSAMVTMLIMGLIVCGIFVFLGGWSRNKPFAAIVSGICLYAILVVLDAIADPTTLFRGIIFKIFIIICLVNGIRAALDAEKMKKETHLS